MPTKNYTVVTRICVTCNNPFPFQIYRHKESPGKFCSRTCFKNAPFDEADFWNRFNRTDGCWMWKGVPNKKTGYAWTWRDGRKFTVHRIAWEITNGTIPGALCVLHKCDVRNCGRPDHLFLGTYLDNNHDAAIKGRTKAKINPPIVHQMFKLTSEGRTQDEIAVSFGVSQSLVSAVLLRKLWTHVDINS